MGVRKENLFGRPSWYAERLFEAKLAVKKRGEKWNQKEFRLFCKNNDLCYDCLCVKIGEKLERCYCPACLLDRRWNEKKRRAEQKDKGKVCKNCGSSVCVPFLKEPYCIACLKYMLEKVEN